MNLTRRTVASTAWSTSGLVINQIVNLARLAVLARLLDPEAFGLYAMVMVLYPFLMSIGDLGSSSAIIQRPAPSHSLLSTVFVLNLLFGLLLSVSTWVLAPTLAALYGEPRVIALTRWMSLLFVLTSLGYVHAALLRKEMDFKRLTIANISSNFAASIVSVFLASEGYGYLALAAQMLIHALMFTLHLWITKRFMPLPLFSTSDLKSVFSYTANLTAFNFVNYAASNADKFLVGRVFGSEMLGFYYIGFRLIIMPMTQLTASIRNVVFSALASIQDDPERLRRTFLRVVYALSVVVAPATMFLMVSADLVVAVLFGSGWNETVEIVMILAPVGLIEVVTSPTSILCLVKKRTDILFKLSLLSLALIPACVGIGLQFGLTGAAIGLAVSKALLLVPSLKMTLWLARIPVGEYLKVIAVPTILAVCMAVLVIAIRQLGLASIVPAEALQLLLLAAGCTLFYLSASWRRISREIRDLRARSK